MSTVVDVTKIIKSDSLDWSLSGRQFTAQFPISLQHTQCGIYLLLQSNNNTDLPVRDRNGTHREVIRPRGNTVKSGKFLGGFAYRMLTNHKHGHHCGPGYCGDVPVFPDVLDLALVLDLGNVRNDGVQRLETLWNRTVRSFLAERRWNDPIQNGHSESRFLLACPVDAGPQLTKLFRRFARAHLV